MTMNPTKILLLDLNPTASSSVALRAILESYSGPDGITLRREVVTDNSAASAGQFMMTVSGDCSSSRTVDSKTNC